MQQVKILLALLNFSIRPYNRIRMGIERLFRWRKQAPARREVAFSYPGVPQELQGDPDVLLAQSVLSGISNLHARVLAGEKAEGQVRPLYSIDLPNYDTQETVEVDVYFDVGQHRPEELAILAPAMWDRMSDPRKVGEIRPYLRAVARKLRTEERRIT